MKAILLQKGITLLIAVVILSASISIALGIAYIVFNELQINRAARESYKAFFSAESGRECALYYHRGNAVNFSSGMDYWDPDDPCRDGGACSVLPICLGQPVTGFLYAHETPAGYDYHKFSFALNDPSNPKRTCANVNIRSTKTTGAESVKIFLIESLGTNCASGPTAVNRTIETCFNPEGTGCGGYFP